MISPANLHGVAFSGGSVVRGRAAIANAKLAYRRFQELFVATQGDGEVIVAGYHYWGEQVLTRLRGMFAFVIHDREEGVVFGARDPLPESLLPSSNGTRSRTMSPRDGG